ncbi:MAG: class I SAM-dependent methyltransferase [Rhodospirillaceae bacterium]|nr:class I SAM-dependent methyltransferase [Rhodospirillaceae bacterium]
MKPDLENLYATNSIYRSLLDRKLVSTDCIEIIHHRTRDMEIPVLVDRQTRVIFLGEIPGQRFYTEAGDGSDLDGDEHLSHTIEGGVVRSKKLEDEERRLDQFLSLLENRSLCDFGTGHGLFLDQCVGVASKVSGVELRLECISDIDRRLGDAVQVKPTFSDFVESFDVVTMFHVLEHLEDQLVHLRDAWERLKSGGVIIVEIPHARDFLIEQMELEAFYDFGFWSEHLILHTQGSIDHYLQAAGFVDIEITPFQRFGYANHLYWLRHGKPGGHEIYKDIPTEEFDRAYKNFLCQRNWSDTLIAIAKKP